MGAPPTRAPRRSSRWRRPTAGTRRARGELQPARLRLPPASASSPGAPRGPRSSMKLDTDPDPVCPICRLRIRDPDRRARLGGAWVHEVCWWAPFESSGDPLEEQGARRRAVSLDAAVAALGQARGVMHCDQCWAQAAGFGTREDRLKLQRLTRVFTPTTQPAVSLGDCGICGKTTVFVIGYGSHGP